jgi:hypothetical protein
MLLTTTARRRRPPVKYPAIPMIHSPFHGTMMATGIEIHVTRPRNTRDCTFTRDGANAGSGHADRWPPAGPTKHFQAIVVRQTEVRMPAIAANQVESFR